MNIKAGHSSSGVRGGSFRVEAGPGGEVRMSSGSADISGAVLPERERGTGGVRSENAFPFLLGSLLSTRLFCFNTLSACSVSNLDIKTGDACWRQRLPVDNYRFLLKVRKLGVAAKKARNLTC